MAVLAGFIRKVHEFHVSVESHGSPTSRQFLDGSGVGAHALMPVRQRLRRISLPARPSRQRPKERGIERPQRARVGTLGLKHREWGATSGRICWVDRKRYGSPLAYARSSSRTWYRTSATRMTRIRKLCRLVANSSVTATSVPTGKVRPSRVGRMFLSLRIVVKRSDLPRSEPYQAPDYTRIPKTGRPATSAVRVSE